MSAYRRAYSTIWRFRRIEIQSVETRLNWVEPGRESCISLGLCSTDKSVFSSSHSSSNQNFKSRTQQPKSKHVWVIFWQSDKPRKSIKSIKMNQLIKYNKLIHERSKNGNELMMTMMICHTN